MSRASVDSWIRTAILVLTLIAGGIIARLIPSPYHETAAVTVPPRTDALLSEQSTGRAAVDGAAADPRGPAAESRPMHLIGAVK
jgi:hypothetical protein